MAVAASDESQKFFYYVAKSNLKTLLRRRTAVQFHVTALNGLRYFE